MELIDSLICSWPLLARDITPFWRLKLKSGLKMLLRYHTLLFSFFHCKVFSSHATCVLVTAVRDTVNTCLHCCAWKWFFIHGLLVIEHSSAECLVTDARLHRNATVFPCTSLTFLRKSQRLPLYILLIFLKWDICKCYNWALSLVWLLKVQVIIRRWATRGRAFAWLCVFSSSECEVADRSFTMNDNNLKMCYSQTGLFVSSLDKRERLHIRKIISLTGKVMMFLKKKTKNRNGIKTTNVL